MDQVWPQVKMSNVKHDYTAGYFSRNVDRPLKSFFTPLHDYNDDLTPDIIQEKNGAILVHEFATTKIPNLEKTWEAYKLKHPRYDAPLLARAERGEACHLHSHCGRPRTSGKQFATDRGRCD